MTARGRDNTERSAASESRFSRVEFNQMFPDNDACLEWLWRNYYSADGLHAYCPKCDRERRFHRVATRQSYSCASCGRHVHPTAGTIFHKSSTDLRMWFEAIFLMASTRCGVSAKQLERDLGVTYKTAWRMFHKIRNELMPQGSDPMTGEVELDEAYFGGRPRLGDIRSFQEAALWAEQKAKVFGMAERQGQVAAVVVPSVKTPVLMEHVKARVLPEAVIYTDEARQYQYGIKRAGYQHKRIHHAAHVYVDGDTHTQTIEGFWSLVKRGIGGSHHAVSAKYLQGYLNEYVWRYNHRRDPRAMFFGILENVAVEASASEGSRSGDGSPA
ncbi:MAG: IS1595 family transposase [Candidatus Dormiibacterota bacterium]